MGSLMATSPPSLRLKPNPRSWENAFYYNHQGAQG